jgi:hypothetical protein
VITVFIPVSPVIDAARREAQSALPHAPIVDDEPVPRRSGNHMLRGAAARLLSAAAARIEPNSDVAIAHPHG